MEPILACGCRGMRLLIRQKKKTSNRAHINPTGGGSGLSYPDKQRQSAYQQKRKVNCEIRSLWKIVHAASMLLQYYYHIPAKNEIRIMAKIFWNILLKITD